MFSNRRRPIAFIPTTVVLLLFIVLITYFLLIPAIINIGIEKYRPQIENMAKDTVGMPVTLGKIKTALTGNLRIRINVDNIKVKHSDQRDFISAGDTHVEIYLPALLKNRIKIKKITVDNPVVYITRLQNGKFDIAELFPKKAPSKYKTVYRNTDITATNYILYFRDQLVRPNQSFTISGNKAEIYNFDPDKAIEMALKGQITAPNRPNTLFNLNYSSKLPLNTKNIWQNKLNLEGYIQNFYPDMFLIYLNTYTPYHYSSISGAVNSRFNFILSKANSEPDKILIDAALANLMAVKSGKDLSLSYPGITRISINAQKSAKDLIINAADISSKYVNTTLNGSIANITSKSPLLKLNLNITNSKLLSLLYMIPEEIYIPNNIVSKLKKYNAQGDLKTNLAIRGTSQKPDLFGSLVLNNISMITNIKTIPNGNLRIDFLGKVYKLNSKFFIAKSEFIRIAGNVAPQFNKLNLNIRSSIVDLGKFQVLLLSLRDILNFKLGPLSNVAVEGTGDIDFDVSGYFKNPDYKGLLNIINAKVAYTGLSQPLQNLTGKLRITPQGVNFDNLHGIIAQSPITVIGQASPNDINITLGSNKLNLAAIKKLIQDSPALAATQKLFADITSMTGYTDATLRMAGNINQKNIFKDLRLAALGASITPRQLGFPVRFLKGTALITSTGLFTEGIQSEVLGAPTRISGQITGFGAKITPRIRIAVTDLQFSKINELTRAPIVPTDAKRLINEFKNKEGALNADIHILPAGYRADLKFNDTSAIYAANSLPIILKEGSLSVTPSEITFKALSGRIAKSSLNLNGTISNYQTSPLLDLRTLAKVSSEDIDKYINPYLEEPITAKGEFPVLALIQGHLDNWKVNAQMVVNKGEYIHIRQDIGLPLDQVRVLSIKATGSQNKVTLEDLEIATGNNSIESSAIATPEQIAASGFTPVLIASGTIDKLQSSSPVLDNFTVNVPNPLSVKILNPAVETNAAQPFFTDGYFTGRAFIQGPVSSPVVTGEGSLTNVVVPSKTTTINYATFDLTTDNMILRDSSIDIADSHMNITATANKSFRLPISITTMSIAATTFDVGGITEAFKQPPDQQTQEAAETPPVIIQDGIIRADELILNNLITSNFYSNFTLTPNWALTLPNFAFNSAGGRAYGNMLYNIKTTELVGSTTASGMSANAVATTFLNVPNEVYGTLEGTVVISTKGSTSDELISNADGSAVFKITDGRLVRLGSLEYLLSSASTVLSGIGNININKIFNLIIPQRTGEFQVLGGTIYAQNGVLTTDNIASRGKKLSLFLKGSLNMTTDYADITILGRLSRRVSGLLGPLGSVSINTFVGFIPGIGFIPGAPGEAGLLDVIPFINRIPLLGIGGRQRYRRFVVKTEGNLYDPNSVKSFRWLD